MGLWLILAGLGIAGVTAYNLSSGISKGLANRIAPPSNPPYTAQGSSIVTSGLAGIGTTTLIALGLGAYLLLKK